MSADALAVRAAFAAALLDVAPARTDVTPAALGGVSAHALGDVVVLLAASPSAAAIAREAPPLHEPPDVITPWARARRWAAQHVDAPVAAAVSLAELRAASAAAEARGLALVDVDPDPRRLVVDGCLARPFVFVPRSRAPRRAKLRLDRVQDARVRANGAGLAPEQPETIEDFAFAVVARARPEPLRVKDVVREARASVKAQADDGKRVAAALVRAWMRSDVELSLG